MKGGAREINTRTGASALVNPMKGAAGNQADQALAQEGAIEVNGKNIVVRGTR